MSDRFTRRTAIRSLAALAAAPLVEQKISFLPACEREPNVPRERPNILYALSTGCWGPVTPPGKPLPLLQILDETAAAGFNGVRLTGFPQILESNGLSEEDYAAALDKRGLRFSTISFGGRYFDREEQPEILERARRALALHQRLGAKAAVFFPPGVVPAVEEQEALAESCRFFNQMGRMAVEEYGIRMGLHNHTDSLIEKPHQVNYYLEHTDPDFVFCAWDTAHLHLGGCDVQQVYRDTVNRIVYTDFKDAVRDPATTDYVAPNGTRYAGDSHQGRFYNSIYELGRGEIDFVPLMNLLKGAGYRGWINHDLDTIRVSCAESWRIAMGYIQDRLDPIYQ